MKQFGNFKRNAHIESTNNMYTNNRYINRIILQPIPLLQADLKVQKLYRWKQSFFLSLQSFFEHSFSTYLDKKAAVCLVDGGQKSSQRSKGI